MDADLDPPVGEELGTELEQRLPARTPPPPKKPLDIFLAEFEQRLAEHPDEPATDVHLDLEARAEGARRPPLGSRRAGAPLHANPPADSDLGAEPAPAEDPGPLVDARGEVEAAQSVETAPTTDAAPSAEAAPTQERRRHRGRRHRRRRH